MTKFSFTKEYCKNGVCIVDESFLWCVFNSRKQTIQRDLEYEQKLNELDEKYKTKNKELDENEPLQSSENKTYYGEVTGF